MDLPVCNRGNRQVEGSLRCRADMHVHIVANEACWDAAATVRPPYGPSSGLA